VTAGRLTEPQALLLSGTGRYADPWHPFAETSAALAGLLREQGFGVEMADDVDAALARLAAPDGPADADLPDLLVVNVGLPRDGRPALTVHATHTHEDREHPVMWSLDRRPGRSFFDGLGLDAASYDSPEHRVLLLGAITWLAAS
jgi:hypothetical protein